MRIVRLPAAAGVSTWTLTVTVQAIYPASILNSYLYSRNLIIDQLSSINQQHFFSLPAMNLYDGTAETQSCSSTMM